MKMIKYDIIVVTHILMIIIMIMTIMVWYK